MALDTGISDMKKTWLIPTYRHADPPPLLEVVESL